MVKSKKKVITGFKPRITQESIKILISSCGLLTSIMWLRERFQFKTYSIISMHVNRENKYRPIIDME